MLPPNASPLEKAPVATFAKQMDRIPNPILDQVPGAVLGFSSNKRLSAAGTYMYRVAVGVPGKPQFDIPIDDYRAELLALSAQHGGAAIRCAEWYNQVDPTISVRRNAFSAIDRNTATIKSCTKHP